MLFIEEKRAKKVPGYTSFFIENKGGRDENEFFNSLEFSIYHADLNQWEIPITLLAQNLSYFIYKYDINIKLLDDDKPLLNERLDMSNYKLRPFEHQVEAIEYGLLNEKWLLLDDMGLGKTATAIHVAEELKRRGFVNKCLIICGVNILKTNWKKEIAKHGKESAKILGQEFTSTGRSYIKTIRERKEELLKPIDEFFVITNIETLRDDGIIKALKKKKPNKFDLIICDEIHKVNNTTSKQGANFQKLNAKYKIGLSGTLIRNTPLDCYAALKWLGVENTALTYFKKFYTIKGGLTGKEVIGYKNTAILKDQLEQVSIRRTKDMLKDKLQPKTIIKEIIELDIDHRYFYDSVKNLVKAECDKIELNTENVLALTTRLRQATACPAILTDRGLRSTKLNHIEGLIRDIVKNNDKVLVFGSFKYALNELAKLITDLKPLIITGDIKPDVIDERIELFKTGEDAKIILATPDKLGTGESLEQASYVIFIDTPFTAADVNQAAERAHRITSPKPVFVYFIIAEDTIDERVDQIITLKETLSDYIIDHTVSEDTIELLKEYILS